MGNTIANSLDGALRSAALRVGARRRRQPGVVLLRLWGWKLEVEVVWGR